jgi:hypothetical protein
LCSLCSFVANAFGACSLPPCTKGDGWGRGDSRKSLIFRLFSDTFRFFAVFGGTLGLSAIPGSAGVPPAVFGVPPNTSLSLAFFADGRVARRDPASDQARRRSALTRQDGRAPQDLRPLASIRGLMLKFLIFQGAHLTFWQNPLKSSDDVPSPRGAGRGIGRGVPPRAPPHPNPLLHKYVEEREKGKAAQKVRCALFQGQLM